jgi:hypothetical protein
MYKDYYVISNLLNELYIKNEKNYVRGFLKVKRKKGRQKYLNGKEVGKRLL